MAKMAKVFGIVGAVILVIAFGPLVTIWSVNTLFPAAAIPYTWATWLATVIIVGGPLKGFSVALK
jgi:hypothetical protein